MKFKTLETCFCAFTQLYLFCLQYVSYLFCFGIATISIVLACMSLIWDTYALSLLICLEWYTHSQSYVRKCFSYHALVFLSYQFIV